MLEALTCFLKARKISLQVLSGAGGSVRVLEPEAPQRCTLSRLYVGGFIACETARALAVRLNLRVSQMGQLLDFLNIKVRHCGLGCFK
jgi:hypothetical protein